MSNEADTCRILITPKLHAAQWSDNQIPEQVTFTDGRIVPVGRHAIRREQWRADYILRYDHNYPIAVVEAKVEDVNALRRLQSESQLELDALLPSPYGDDIRTG
jgi:type I restriction enzyme R subunit